MTKESKIKRMNKFRILVRLLSRRYIQFRRSLYSRVLLIIGILSLLFLVSYQVIFRTVNEVYINTTIYQNGNNIGSIVEGALYHSMLENNKQQLQNTLDIINTMPGIDDVSMYNHEGSLSYASFTQETEGHINPNCRECHVDFAEMFPQEKKSYKIIRVNDQCQMNVPNSTSRHLLIHSPILNQPSCSNNAACHAHNQSDRVLGSLIIKMPLDKLDAAVNKASTEYTLLGIFITILFASLLILFTIKRIKDPLNEVIDVSKAIATGDTSIRLPIRKDELDDISMLSIAFNQMLDKLEDANNELQNWSKQLEYKVQKKSEELGEIQSELISIERKASLGKLSSSVAHELNNPLSGILVYAKLVRKRLNNLSQQDDEKLQPIYDHLKLIEEETKRCGEIVKGLLDFSHDSQENFEPRSLHQLINESYQLLHHQMELSNIRFSKNLMAEQDTILCSPNQIKQVLVAMVVNASDAINDHGEISLETVQTDPADITLMIKDNGIGIAREDISKIFEPFYTTKQNGQGLGLGLAIVHGIVRSHGGKIYVQTDQGQGTTFSIRLPLFKDQEHG